MPEITDNDLIQMLRCCGKDDESADCGHCPVADYGCAGAFLRTADRLEKLVAENEALKTKLWPEDCKDMAEYSCPRVLQLRQEIDHLREATNMMPQWVSVSERLPGRFLEVLLFDAIDEDVFIGELDGNDDWFIAKYEDEPFSITHWMPLPKPPCAEEV